MSALRILVADDHEVVRRGIRALLDDQPGWRVVAEAVDGFEAVAKARELRPDVAVIDITMPGMNGLEATRQICASVPETQVLILTMHQSEELVREVSEAGARGCVLKSDAGKELVAALASLRAYRAYFTGRVAGVTPGEYPLGSEADREAPSLRLTSRERQVVQLLAEGRSAKEAAGILGVSVKTVDAHRTNILRKLGLHSAVDLARYAIRNNIIMP